MLDLIRTRTRSGWPGTGTRWADEAAAMPTLRIALKSIRRPSGSAENCVAAVLLLRQRASTSSSKS